MITMDVKIFFKDLMQFQYSSRALNVQTSPDGRWVIVKKKDSVDMFPERDISAIYVTNIAEEEDDEEE